MAMLTEATTTQTRAPALIRSNRLEGRLGGWRRTSGPRTLSPRPWYRPPGGRQAAPRGLTRGRRRLAPTPARPAGGSRAPERQSRQVPTGGQQVPRSKRAPRMPSLPTHQPYPPARPRHQHRRSVVTATVKGRSPASQQHPGAPLSGRGVDLLQQRLLAQARTRTPAPHCECVRRTCTTMAWTGRRRRVQQHRWQWRPGLACASVRTAREVEGRAAAIGAAEPSQRRHLARQQQQQHQQLESLVLLRGPEGGLPSPHNCPRTSRAAAVRSVPPCRARSLTALPPWPGPRQGSTIPTAPTHRVALPTLGRFCTTPLASRCTPRCIWEATLPPIPNTRTTS